MHKLRYKSIPFDHFIPQDTYVGSDPFESVFSKTRSVVCLIGAGGSGALGASYFSGDICTLSDQFDRPVCLVEITGVSEKQLDQITTEEVIDLGMSQKEFEGWAGYLVTNCSDSSNGVDVSGQQKEDIIVLWIKFRYLSLFGSKDSLCSDRLQLRPGKLEDAEAAHEVYSDPESMKYLPSDPHVNLNETKSLIRSKWLDLNRSRGVFSWSVLDVRDQSWIGMITFFNFKKKMCCLGYMLNQNYGGKGLTTEALRLALPDAFHRWDLHRIEANVDPDNQASMRVLEKAGFKFEGRSRQNFEKNGVYLDSMNFSLLRSDLF